MISGAGIAGEYRYRLWRIWDESKQTLVVCMLNPSKADGKQDDPTIRKTIRFARLWGYGGIHVVNLYSFRATNPTELWGQYTVPVGPLNSIALAEAITAPGAHVLCAWGATDAPDKDAHVGYVQHLIRTREVFAFCLGRTADGSPKHPLYLPYTTEREVFL